LFIAVEGYFCGQVVGFLRLVNNAAEIRCNCAEIGQFSPIGAGVFADMQQIALG
jgi:hypothetical protein